MNKLITILLPCFTLCPGLLPAQDSPAPPPPLVQVPPPGSSWIVTIDNPDVPKPHKDAATPPSVTKIELPVQLTMKYGLNKMIMGQISYSTNRQDIFYVSDGYVLLPVRNTGQAFAQSLQTSEGDPYSLKVSSFPGTHWITPQCYKGEEASNGFNCRHYAKVEKRQSGNVPLDAWIRKVDGYPVQVKVGEMTYHFAAATSFQQEIELPDAFRAALNRLRVEKSALDALQKANEAQK